jgi:hypothetical protein
LGGLRNALSARRHATGLARFIHRERRASALNQNDQSNDNKDDGDLNNKTALSWPRPFVVEQNDRSGATGAAGSMPVVADLPFWQRKRNSPVARLLLEKSAKLRDLI